jgi:hypothetical protein
MSWFDTRLNRPPPSTVAAPKEVQPPPPPPPAEVAPRMRPGMPTRDEFVAASKPAGPDLTGGAQVTPLSATVTDGATSTGPTAKPASEYARPGGLEGDAYEVDFAFRTGGASLASQKLADLTVTHANEPGYADALLKASEQTLQGMADQLGERTRKGSLDDEKKDAFGKLNTTYETLKNLSVVADKVSPESLKLLGQKLAAATPDDNELNQLDDSLAELREESMPGLAKLAGTLVTELQASGKNSAAKELLKEHKPLQEVSTAPAVDGNRWTPGTPLSEAKNAHNTTVRGDFDKARNGDYNWFEGDVSMELNREGRIEMRHDPGHEDGDNLTLTEWLNESKMKGVGVKLDVKNEQVFDNRFLEDVRASGIPQERLMFNLGFGETERHGAETRRMFPNAMLAINPPDDVPVDQQVERMKNLAQREDIKGPVTFVFNYDNLPSKEQIAELQKIGPVSVWKGGAASGTDVGGIKDKLKNEYQVQGMVDIKEDFVDQTVDKVKDTLRGFIRPPFVG